jgi:hypothetical protein
MSVTAAIFRQSRSSLPRSAGCERGLVPGLSPSSRNLSVLRLLNPHYIALGLVRERPIARLLSHAGGFRPQCRSRSCRLARGEGGNPAQDRVAPLHAEPQKPARRDRLAQSLAVGGGLSTRRPHRRPHCDGIPPSAGWLGVSCRRSQTGHNPARSDPAPTEGSATWRICDGPAPAEASPVLGPSATSRSAWMKCSGVVAKRLSNAFATRHD